MRPSLTKWRGCTPRATRSGLTSRGRSLMSAAMSAAWMGIFGLRLACSSVAPSPPSSFVESLSATPFARSSLSPFVSSSTAISSMSAQTVSARSSSASLSPRGTRLSFIISRKSFFGARPCFVRRRGHSFRRSSVLVSLSGVMDGTPWYSRRLRAATS